MQVDTVRWAERNALTGKLEAKSIDTTEYDFAVKLAWQVWSKLRSLGDTDLLQFILVNGVPMFPESKHFQVGYVPEYNPDLTEYVKES